MQCSVLLAVDDHENLKIINMCIQFCAYSMLRDKLNYFSTIFFLWIDRNVDLSILDTNQYLYNEFDKKILLNRDFVYLFSLD